MRPSNAAMAAWIIASVITSLCAIKFLRAFPATRNICTVARCGTKINTQTTLYLLMSARLCQPVREKA
jgi:hypothetical protein